jgi:hypothetical protein
MRQTKQSKKQIVPTNKDLAELGKRIHYVFETGYLSKPEAFKFAFLKGVLAGAGGVLGSTIVIALLLWILSLLGEIPFIGDIADSIQNTVN